MSVFRTNSDSRKIEPLNYRHVAIRGLCEMGRFQEIMMINSVLVAFIVLVFFDHKCGPVGRIF